MQAQWFQGNKVAGTAFMFVALLKPTTSQPINTVMLQAASEVLQFRKLLTIYLRLLFLSFALPGIAFNCGPGTKLTF